VITVVNGEEQCFNGDSTLQQRYDMFLERKASVEHKWKI